MSKTYSLLDISTAHVSKETANWLGAQAVARYARERGCDYLLLDRDADTVDGLPVYDW